MDDTLITLQETVAHQAIEIEQLHSELYAQQKDIAALQRQLKSLTDKLTTTQEASGQSDVPEPPPPHY